MHSSYKKVSGMTAEIKIRRCYGCGAILQSQDRFEPGFVSKVREGHDEGLCDRCYTLRHPNPDQAQTLDADFAKLLSDAKEGEALFCYVVDAFALDSSIIPGVSSHLGENVLVVINKTDILPKDTDRAELIRGVRVRMEQQGLKPVGYIVTSAFQDFDFASFIMTIDRLRHGKDVYFVGVLGVGKSTLINNFLKEYQNKTDRTITKERLGTDGSMSLTAIPLDQDSTLYDTPGIFDPESLLNQIDKRTLKYVVPKSRVEPVNATVKDGEAILLGGLAYVEFSAVGKSSISLFFSRDIDLIKAKASRAGIEFTEGIKASKARPISQTIRDANDLSPNPVVLPDDGKPAFVSIKGFGKIRFNRGEGQKVTVFAPKGVGVVVREA